MNTVIWYNATQHAFPGDLDSAHFILVCSIGKKPIVTDDIKNFDCFSFILVNEVNATKGNARLDTMWRANILGEKIITAWKATARHRNEPKASQHPGEKAREHYEAY